MPLAAKELHERDLAFPVLVGGAAINRDFGRRILYPKGKESDEVYDPGVFYCKDAFQGLDTMDQLVDGDARAALVEGARDEARTLREKPVVVDDAPPVTDSSVRSTARTDVAIPTPPFWGAREIEVDLDHVFPYLPRHDRICLTDFFRPLESGERDVVALQGVTVGPEVTELMARLEQEGEFAEQ